MKRILLIISILFLSIGTVSAQYMSAMVHETSPGGLTGTYDDAVTRNWNRTKTITAHHNGQGVVFSHTDFTYECSNLGSGGTFGGKYSDPIPGIHITDMTFVGAYAVFCGYTTTTPMQGVIGHFKVTDFVNNLIFNVEYHVYNSITRFKKLVAYRNAASNYTAVAIGSQNWTSAGCNALVVEDDIFNCSPLTGNNVLWFSPGGPSALQENMWDIVLTGSKILIVGYDTSPAVDALCIRVTEKNNVLYSPSVHTQYYYPASSMEALAMVRATMLDDTHLAISYTHGDPISSAVTNRIRLIDITTMQNVNSQEFPLAEKEEWFFEQTYNKNTQQLVILRPQVLSSQDVADFVWTKPFSTSLYTASVTIGDNAYTTLDNFIDEDFVAVGANHWYYQRTTSVPVTCPSSSDLKVSVIPNCEVQSRSINLSDDNNNPTISNSSYNAYAGSFNNFCGNPQ